MPNHLNPSNNDSTSQLDITNHHQIGLYPRLLGLQSVYSNQASRTSNSTHSYLPPNDEVEANNDTQKWVMDKNIKSFIDFVTYFVRKKEIERLKKSINRYYRKKELRAQFLEGTSKGCVKERRSQVLNPWFSEEIFQVGISNFML